MKLIPLIIAAFFSVPALAEDVEEQEYRNGIIRMSRYTPDIEMPDSLRLPDVDFSGRVMSRAGFYSPWYGGLYGWNLHEGLNVSIGASATVTSGNGGTTSGFGQNFSVMYAEAVNQRFSYAIGGYINNYSFGPGSYREGGITAMLNYRFSDRLEGYAYIQKSITHSDNGRMPFYQSPFYHPGMYGMHAGDFLNAGDRIGAGLRYQMGKHSFIQFNFEYARMPENHYRPWLRHGGYPGYGGYPWYY